MATYVESDTPTGELVGRDHERARIADLLADARAGKSGTLILVGEAGIGKTALMADAARGADGMTILRLTGVEPEAGLAFAGLAALTAPLLERLDRLPDAQAAALTGALALGPPAPSDPFAVCAATLSLLAAGAEDGPVLVLVDDAHWLDSESLRAVLFAARRLAADPIALLIASRDEAERIGASDLPTVALGGLDAEAAHVLLERTGAETTERTRVAILEAAGGNPLALIEIHGALSGEERSGARPLPDPLPVGMGIEHAFEKRIDHLGPQAQTGLLVVAAAGSLDGGILRRALEELGAGPDTLGETEASGLLEVGPTVHFRHPLLRAIVYQRGGEVEQRAAHAALAAALDEPHLAQRRAAHLAAAAVPPDDEVADTLEAAADDALRRNGHAAAAVVFEQAALLTTTGEARGRRLRQAAAAYQVSGRLDKTAALLPEALDETDDPMLRAEIERLRALNELFAGAAREAASLLSRQAEALADEHPEAAATRLAESALISMSIGETAAGRQQAERASVLAERSGGAAVIPARLALAQALFMAGESGESLELVTSLLPALEQMDPLHAHQLLQTPTQLLVFLERYDDARRLAERAVAAARTAAAPSLLPLPLCTLSLVDYRTGHWVAAYAHASEAVLLARETGQIGAPLAYAQVFLATVEAARGNGERATAAAQEAQAISQALSADAIFAWAQAAEGLLALGTGDCALAADLLREAHTTFSALGIRDQTASSCVPDLVEALVRDGRPAEAAGVVAALENPAAANHALTQAHLHRCRGLLAGSRNFDSEFRAALEWHDRTSSPFERARTELCYAERLRRTGRRADARTPLRSALRTFERLGARPWAERARAELRATGERVRSHEAASTDELTPHELQVALCVARGATNREAAASLFLTTKTIEFHLRKIYDKLGVRSRAELALRLAPELAQSASALPSDGSR